MRPHDSMLPAGNRPGARARMEGIKGWYRDDHEDRLGGLATGRATPGYGHVVRAGDGAVVRERMHGADRQANAGFPLTVAFESPGGSVYVRLALPRTPPDMVPRQRDRATGAESSAHPAIERDRQHGR